MSLANDITDETIAGCFGGAPGFAFAVRPLDADYALVLLGKLRAEQVAWLNVRARFARWLRDHGVAEPVVARQLAAVRINFQPRLYGPAYDEAAQ
jgi:hypothetical protein